MDQESPDRCVEVGDFVRQPRGRCSDQVSVAIERQHSGVEGIGPALVGIAALAVPGSCIYGLSILVGRLAKSNSAWGDASADPSLAPATQVELAPHGQR